MFDKGVDRCISVMLKKTIQDAFLMFDAENVTVEIVIRKMKRVRIDYPTPPGQVPYDPGVGGTTAGQPTPNTAYAPILTTTTVEGMNGAVALSRLLPNPGTAAFAIVGLNVVSPSVPWLGSTVTQLSTAPATNPGDVLTVSASGGIGFAPPGGTPGVYTPYQALVTGAGGVVASTTSAPLGQVLTGQGSSASPVFAAPSLPPFSTHNAALRTNITSGVIEPALPIPTQTAVTQILQMNSASGAFQAPAFTNTATSTGLWMSIANTLAPALPRVNVRVFASGTSYTPTSGTLFFKVVCVGGGGGGGGWSTSGSITVVGSGGGAGAVAVAFFPSAFGSVGGPFTYAIGAAGTGTTGGGNPGGATTFNGTVSATGGLGAPAAGATTNVGAAGGTFSGASYGTNGGYGGPSNAATSSQWGGCGGSNQYGVGGQTSVANGVVGNDGIGYGAGGGGIYTTTSGTSVAGGNGTTGAIVIEEYLFTQS